MFLEFNFSKASLFRTKNVVIDLRNNYVQQVPPGHPLCHPGDHNRDLIEELLALPLPHFSPDADPRTSDLNKKVICIRHAVSCANYAQTAAGTPEFRDRCLKSANCYDHLDFADTDAPQARGRVVGR